MNAHYCEICDDFFTQGQHRQTLEHLENMLLYYCNYHESISKVTNDDKYKSHKNGTKILMGQEIDQICLKLLYDIEYEKAGIISERIKTFY